MGNKVLYLHRKESDNSVFYVGIGTSKRPYSKAYRNKWWHNTVAKHGLIIDVIETGLSQKEAVESEIDLIELIGRKCMNEGPLVNITAGGEGSTGLPCSEAKKKKISESCKGRVGTFIGIEHTQETKDKIAAKAKKRVGVLNKKSIPLICISPEGIETIAYGTPDAVIISGIGRGTIKNIIGTKKPQTHSKGWRFIIKTK